jgi:hypothetical protein
MISMEEAKIGKGEAKTGKGGKKKAKGRVRGEGGVKKDFIDEVLGKIVVIRLEDEADPVVGKVLDNAPYWLKMVDANGKLFYVNKAYIKILLPAKEG